MQLFFLQGISQLHTPDLMHPLSTFAVIVYIPFLRFGLLVQISENVFVSVSVSASVCASFCYCFRLLTDYPFAFSLVDSPVSRFTGSPYTHTHTHTMTETTTHSCLFDTDVIDLH